MISLKKIKNYEYNSSFLIILGTKHYSIFSFHQGMFVQIRRKFSLNNTVTHTSLAVALIETIFVRIKWYNLMGVKK